MQVFVRHVRGNVPIGEYLPLNYQTILWNTGCFALIYSNIPSTDPDDYYNAGDQGGGDAFLRLIQYCNEGSWVGASFRELHNDRILVGQINPNTFINIIPEEINGIWHKRIPMMNPIEVHYHQQPLLMNQPQQHTICQWLLLPHGYLEHAYLNQPHDAVVYSLDPNQLEVLCQEYLRVSHGMFSLVMPIGRTLLDIDIFGLSQNGKIMAQVTFSDQLNEVTNKMNVLAAYGQNNNVQLFMFGRQATRVEHNAITYISIEDVFECMDNNNIYRNLLNFYLHR